MEFWLQSYCQKMVFKWCVSYFLEKKEIIFSQVSRFLSIHLAVNHTTCVRVGACVGVHHHSVHCPLHWVLVYILWSCKNLKEK